MHPESISSDSADYKMVLAKPDNKHVLKAFDLTGKVAAITGESPKPAWRHS
jgi:hypothetical protein